MSAARADSLTSYIELLEYDLTVCQIRGSAELDSTRVQLDILEYKLSIAEEARAKWYQDPRLWFLVGGVSTALIIGSTLQITF